jgi:uncharacterized membrane protein YraQ (UPF0718 family)
MEPLQPQQPINNPQPAFNSMRLVAGILIALIIALVAYFLFSGQQTTAPTDQVQNNSQSTQPATEVDQLEQENSSQDFSEIETDFGAEVNAAAQ